MLAFTTFALLTKTAPSFTENAIDCFASVTADVIIVTLAAGTRPLTTFLILTAFANGCTAMTGVEAVSDGVPSFKKPESKNAAATLVTMAVGDDPLPVDPTLALTRQFTIKGSSQNERADLVEVLDLLAQKRIHPVLEVYRLEEVNTVFDRLDRGAVRYRAVFDLRDDA